MDKVCKFFDGQSSTAHQASVSVKDSNLKIDLPHMSLEWPFSELTVLERPHEGKPALIGCKIANGARLIVSDLELYHNIIQYIPKRHIKLSHVHHPWRILAVLSVLTAIGFVFFTWGIPTYSPWIAKRVPHSWDDNLGKFVLMQVASGNKECVAVQGLKAVKKLNHKLTSNQNIKHKFDIKVLDMPLINAFAVPGYHLILTKGLLDQATNPDQIAGILAHEMAHGIEHHPTAHIIREVGLGILFSAAFGSTTDLGLSFVNLSYSRKVELEADTIGVNLLNDAHISSKGLIEFFEMLKKMQGDMEAYFKYVSTHPQSKDRIINIEKLTKKQKYQPSLSNDEWQALQNICSERVDIQYDLAEEN